MRIAILGLKKPVVWWHFRSRFSHGFLKLPFLKVIPRKLFLEYGIQSSRWSCYHAFFVDAFMDDENVDKAAWVFHVSKIHTTGWALSSPFLDFLSRGWSTNNLRGLSWEKGLYGGLTPYHLSTLDCVERNRENFYFIQELTCNLLFASRYTVLQLI